MTSTTAAASKPASRLSRYISEPCSSLMRSRCALGQPVELQPLGARSRARGATRPRRRSRSNCRVRRAARAAACPRRSRGRAPRCAPLGLERRDAPRRAAARCRLIALLDGRFLARPCAASASSASAPSSSTSRASASRVEAALVLQVAAGDQLALGVRGQPALAVAQQLLDLVVADPVVLVVVEHRDQHVEVRQQLAQRQRRARASTREVRALAPVGNAVVERVARRRRPRSRAARTAGAGAPRRRGTGSDGEPGVERDRRRRPAPAGPCIGRPAPCRTPARSPRSGTTRRRRAGR